MGGDWVIWLIFAAVAIAALFAIGWVFAVLQSAYFWIAEKVTGRDVEGEHLDRLVARERLQKAKDAALGTNHDRKRSGAAIVAGVVFFLAMSVGLIWWQALLLGAAVYVGLHMVGGVSLKWWE